MKKPVIIDVETTIFQKGNPYSARNKLCLVGIRYDGTNHIFDVEHGGKPYADVISKIRTLFRFLVTNGYVIVAFNGKFDLAWLRRYGIFDGISPIEMDLWDCQLAHFLHTNQSESYPSLDSCLKYHGLSGKSDIVDREYWSKGIDTPEIPLEILTTYLEGDLEGTDKLYTSQLSSLSRSKLR